MQVPELQEKGVKVPSDTDASETPCTVIVYLVEKVGVIVVALEMVKVQGLTAVVAVQLPLASPVSQLEIILEAEFAVAVRDNEVPA